ncbi:hypothetical protein KQI52_10795 [bacterium]|nr:hypothetical protein [bacterium]
MNRQAIMEQSFDTVAQRWKRVFISVRRRHSRSNNRSNGQIISLARNDPTGFRQLRGRGVEPRNRVICRKTKEFDRLNEKNEKKRQEQARGAPELAKARRCSVFQTTYPIATGNFLVAQGSRGLFPLKAKTTYLGQSLGSEM